MSREMDGGRDADDWREQDWCVGDLVFIEKVAGSTFTGVITCAESSGIGIGSNIDGPTWYRFHFDDIRDMVRLVPEPHKVGDQVGDQAGPATDIASRVRAIEEHLDVSTALVARVSKLEQAAGNHAGWVQPELQRRVEARDAQVADLLKRVTELDDADLSNRICAQAKRIDGALDRQNEQGTRLAGHESQIADLFARVQVAEKRLEDQSLLIRAMIYDGSTKPAACPTCTAPAEHVAALAKAMTREQPKPVAEQDHDWRHGECYDDAGMPYVCFRCKAVAYVTDKDIHDGRVKGLRDFLDRQAPPCTGKEAAEPKPSHDWKWLPSPFEGYQVVGRCAWCGYTVQVPVSVAHGGGWSDYCNAEAGPCTGKEAAL